MPAKKALLLGMYYSLETEPKRGQGFRDGKRCTAMKDLGFDVYTLDDKHDVQHAMHGKHCQANFSDEKRMIKSIQSTWRDNISFDTIILDYFFSPAGWVEFRWTENFFRNTLPSLATSNIIHMGGKIWLPNVGHVSKMLERHKDILGVNFVWHSEKDPSRNPLYRATDNVHPWLMLCPDNMTNTTQLRPLNSEGPFFILKRVPPLVQLITSPKLSAPKTNKKSKFPIKSKETECPKAVYGKSLRSGKIFSKYVLLDQVKGKSPPKKSLKNINHNATPILQKRKLWIENNNTSNTITMSPSNSHFIAIEMTSNSKKKKN